MIYLLDIVFERSFMKKILFSLLSLSLLTSISFADCTKCDTPKKPACGCEEQLSDSCPCDKKISPCDKKMERCSIEDDEYCTYNQCYFDKQFKKLKNALCLTSKQETCIDTLYKNFKSDMEVYHSRYRVQKNKLLEMIECDN